MKITMRVAGDVTILDMIGNMKSPADLEDFSGAVNAELDQNHLKLLLNFKDVGFVNSSGLGRLVLAAKKIGDKSGHLKVVNLAPDLDELFTFTRLKEKIGVFKAEDEALRSFQ
ncbi:MAG: STAS domain-containing protein [Nitrospinae bacterium]|nr:STAS domain-containing protein [Nitrospinota bacterium]